MSCSQARSSVRGTLLQSSAVLDPLSFCVTGLSSLIHFVSRTRQWGGGELSINSEIVSTIQGSPECPGPPHTHECHLLKCP